MNIGKHWFQFLYQTPANRKRVIPDSVRKVERRPSNSTICYQCQNTQQAKFSTVSSLTQFSVQLQLELIGYWGIFSIWGTCFLVVSQMFLFCCVTGSHSNLYEEKLYAIKFGRFMHFRLKQISWGCKRLYCVFFSKMWVAKKVPEL